jgi:predicted RNase H-like HicB family nuclease
MKVREAVKRLEAEGWQLSRMHGSHRQFRHPRAARAGDNRRQALRHLAPQDLGQHHATSRHEGRPMTERRYLIVIEGAEDENYSAYAPDLPGCVATGASVEQCEREMRDAIALHIEGLRETGQPVPEPSALTTAYVRVAA